MMSAFLMYSYSLKDCVECINMCSFQFDLGLNGNFHPMDSCGTLQLYKLLTPEDANNIFTVYSISRSYTFLLSK